MLTVDIILPVVEFTCNKNFIQISEIADVAGHGTFYGFQIINLHSSYFGILITKAVSSWNAPDVVKISLLTQRLKFTVLIYLDIKKYIIIY